MKAAILFLTFLIFAAGGSRDDQLNFTEQGKIFLASSDYDVKTSRQMEWEGEAKRYFSLINRVPFLLDTLNATGKYHWQLLDSLNGIFTVADTVLGVVGSFSCIEMAKHELIFYAAGRYKPNTRTIKGKFAWLAITSVSLGKIKFPMDGQAVFIINFEQKDDIIKNNMLLCLNIENIDSRLKKTVLRFLIGFVDQSLFEPVKDVFKIVVADN